LGEEEEEPRRGMGWDQSGGQVQTINLVDSRDGEPMRKMKMMKMMKTYYLMEYDIVIDMNVIVK
jgi:hypothetical protein